MKDANTTIQYAKARGNVYRFLSAIYLLAPTKDFVENMLDADFLEQLAALFGQGPVAALSSYAGSTELHEDLELIQQDYMDLFAVPAARYVTPFEDIYRGTRVDGSQEPGPLLGVQAIDVKVMYRIAGAEIGETCKELPTHIGVELAFMKFLCDREAEATGNACAAVPPGHGAGVGSDARIYRELQSRFLQLHLNNWFAQLNRAIQEKAGTHFYRAWAQLTEEFVARDAAELVAQITAEKSTQAAVCS